MAESVANTAIGLEGGGAAPAGAPRVSVIIPYRAADAGLEECLRHCAALAFRDFELILLPDAAGGPAFPGAAIYETGRVNPSAKRNLGVKHARGGVLAFIDADAYPAPDWLSSALPLFEDPAVAAVGGPNLSKPSDSLLERAGGEVFSSTVCSGSFSARFRLADFFAPEDLPACNLLVRRRDLEENALGFDESLLTGEDSKLCFDLKELGKKVVYSRSVVVYHHRRRLFGPHLLQVWSYGRDKARLLRRYFSPARAQYFLPAALVLYTAAGLAAALPAGRVAPLFSATMACYLLAAGAAGVLANWRHAPLIFSGIVLTHYTYGLAFIYGLVSGGKGGRTR